MQEKVRERVRVWECVRERVPKGGEGGSARRRGCPRVGEGGGGHEGGEGEGVRAREGARGQEREMEGGGGREGTRERVPKVGGGGGGGASERGRERGREGVTCRWHARLDLSWVGSVANSA
jgi:hypothetical protein